MVEAPAATAVAVLITRAIGIAAAVRALEAVEAALGGRGGVAVAVAAVEGSVEGIDTRL